MTTQERIQLLTQSGQASELAERFSSDDLTSWITSELGHPEALDRFIPHGPVLSRAFAPPILLHIVSGNTPHAAIQSVFRGLLLGSHNIVKLPSSGLPEFTSWVEQLSNELKNLIELQSPLSEHHWQKANAVVAIGSDTTMAAVQQRLQAHQTFIPHGHKISIGIVTEITEHAAILAANDASLYNQRGCLSPHAIYVREQTPGDAHKFADLLANAMEDFSHHSPPEPLNLSEAGAVANLRETSRFAAANSPNHALWESKGSSDWTVIFESSPQLRLSCLNRCVYVKPLPAILDVTTLGEEALHLSTIALHPFDADRAASLANTLPAHRICPLGKSQTPSLFWHHDGWAPLASLVKWKDLG
jgi:hypothetical protein